MKKDTMNFFANPLEILGCQGHEIIRAGLDPRPVHGGLGQDVGEEVARRREFVLVESAIAIATAQPRDCGLGHLTPYVS